MCKYEVYIYAVYIYCIYVCLCVSAPRDKIFSSAFSYLLCVCWTTVQEVIGCDEMLV